MPFRLTPSAGNGPATRITRSPGKALYTAGGVRDSSGMKPRFILPLLLTLSLLFPLPEIRAADGVAGNKLPGAEFAEALSTVTGVAISPLLGVSAYGAVHYYRTPVEQRANLPWFAQPIFWVPALLLVGLVAAKDIFGAAAPATLKKPFDILEALENKISGLVAAGAFVPFVVTIFHQPSSEAAMWSSLGFATADLSWLYNALMIPAALLVFGVVWLVGNTINVFILLSPFTTVDAALKSARLALLATIPATAWINPWVGAVWAGIIVVVCYCLAGWSFRLTCFGAVFVWDTLTFRHRRFVPAATGNKMFLARPLAQTPVRTYGRLLKNAQGRLVLQYRPWLVFPSRSEELPEGKYEIGRGVLYSELLVILDDDTRTLMCLPPRYRGHEAELVNCYGLAGMRDVGLRAAWAWLKGVFGFRRALPTGAP